MYSEWNQKCFVSEKNVNELFCLNFCVTQMAVIIVSATGAKSVSGKGRIFELSVLGIKTRNCNGA